MLPRVIKLLHMPRVGVLSRSLSLSQSLPIAQMDILLAATVEAKNRRTAQEQTEEQL